MSSAPRPQRKPSASSPDHGSWRHSEASARTVSTWPSRTSTGPSPSPSRVGDQVGALGVGGQDLGVEAGLARGSASRYSIAARSLPGRVDGVEADEVAGAPRSLCALEVVGRHRVRADYRRRIRAVAGAPDDLDSGAGARRRRRRDHDGPLPRRRPRRRDQARPDPGHRGRPRRRAGAARAAGAAAARRHGVRRGVRRAERSPARPERGAGSSTRSTAPRATSAASRCGRPCSRSRTTAR